MPCAVASAAPAHARPLSSEKAVRTWPADPDRYVRRVKGGKFQARPHDAVTRERVNLGTFATVEQARKAVERFWWGQAQPKPKFVRKCRNQFSLERGDPERYFVVIPTASADGKRGWRRVGGWYATEAEAAAAAKQFLVASFGRLAAEALLSRRDTSRRAGRY